MFDACLAMADGVIPNQNIHTQRYCFLHVAFSGGDRFILAKTRTVPACKELNA